MYYDVIVVGGGGAGLCAALTAGNDGARTLLVEAGAQLGGSARLSGGAVHAAGTSVQRAAGINDTAIDMYAYYMALNQYKLNPGLILKLCQISAPTLEWLISLGVEFPADRLFNAGLASVPRGHRAVGFGAGIVEVLDRHVSDMPNIDVALGTRVEGLLQENGVVTGIQAADGPVRAHSVVVTTGGFGADQEMVARYLPSTARYGDWVWSIGADTCRGDGLRMGEIAGAEIIGHDSIGALLTPGFGRDFEPFIPGWFIFVNGEGSRFVDESIDYAVSGTIIRELRNGECFAVFDETARLGPSVGREKGGDNYTTPSWTAERLADMAESGHLLKADSIKELANKMGVPVENFENTIQFFNSECERGEDRNFLKKRDLLRPVLTPPFYAARIRPAVIGSTGAGLRTDQNSAVLAQSGVVIPGLFAAGETVGGIFGTAYVGGGGCLINAFGYGRIAGQAASARAARLAQTAG